MLKKKIDIRVEILSYLNEKNLIEYYPTFGFPLELFVINENVKINLFTKENLNSSNYIYFIENKFNQDIAITLKKLLFIGSFLLYEQFSWEYSNKFLYDNFKFNNKKLIIATIFLSQYLDIKIIQLQHYTNKNIKTISKIYSNAIWLERENSEMFDIFYTGLIDTRKLLLDYSNNKGVMLKTFDQIFFSNYYKNYYGVNYIHY